MGTNDLRTPWRPRSLTEGTDPDPRFTLANERTFLAWVRTALGIVAAALGLEAFAGDLLPATLRKVVAAALLILAAVVVVAALYRWLRIEVAMRTGRSLPVPVVFGVLTVFFVGACAVFMSVLLP
ncbi:YidH family protein [Rhodococcus sp. NPDC127528]|uniref:YidH family protein n=1 Tax=unclassified Rhodococcus (in: high G+C Gram-positive bacteria) TaxID=192944 RepID=UPI0036413B6A